MILETEEGAPDDDIIEMGAHVGSREVISEDGHNASSIPVGAEADGAERLTAMPSAHKASKVGNDWGGCTRNR